MRQIARSQQASIEVPTPPFWLLQQHLRYYCLLLRICIITAYIMLKTMGRFDRVWNTSILLPRFVLLLPNAKVFGRFERSSTQGLYPCCQRSQSSLSNTEMLATASNESIIATTYCMPIHNARPQMHAGAGARARARAWAGGRAGGYVCMHTSAGPSPQHTEETGQRRGTGKGDDNTTVLVHARKCAWKERHFRSKKKRIFFSACVP